MEPVRDRSTYSAIFAVIFIVLLVLVIAYNTGQNLYEEWQKTTQQPSLSAQPLSSSGTSLVHGGVVLYENLTDEEADRIIQTLLEQDTQTIDDIDSLESSLLR